jgi:thiopurine S-methyltransferase
VGVEGVETAVRRFFTEHGLVPTESHGAHRRFEAANVAILQGDMLTVRPAEIGVFDAFYDRAAMIALPPDFRRRYVDVLRALLRPSATGLIVSFAHDPCDRDGPPFSVRDEEVRALWPEARKICETPVSEERWAGVPNVRETVWAVRMA